MSVDQDFDPNLQIKDLDTGDIVSIDAFDRMVSEMGSRVRASTLGPRPHLPPDIVFSNFLNQKKDFLFRGSYISDFLTPHHGNVRCVAASPDGKYAASGGEDGLVVLYSLKGPLRIEKTFKAHTDDVVILRFSSDNFLLSCSVDSTAKIWHPSSDKALGTFKHDEPVTAVAFLPGDSSIFVASTLVNAIFVWSIRSNEVIHKTSFVSQPTAVAFSPDGLHVAIGCLNGFCYIYDMPSFRYVTQFIAGPRGKKQKSNEKVTSIEFVGNCHFLIATNDSRIRLFSIENFSVIRKYIGHEGKEGQVLISVSPDNQLFMAPCENTGDLYIWPIDHTQSFKGGGIFSTFLKDRSKTSEGLRFGKNVVVNAACFTAETTKTKLSALVALQNGSVLRVVSQ